MEEVETLVVGKERVGAVIEEKVDDIIIAPFGSPENGRCNSVAAFGVYGSTGLDEEMTESVVVVDCGPLLSARLALPSSGSMSNGRHKSRRKEYAHAVE